MPLIFPPNRASLSSPSLSRAVFSFSPQTLRPFFSSFSISQSHLKPPHLFVHSKALGSFRFAARSVVSAATPWSPINDVVPRDPLRSKIRGLRGKRKGMRPIWKASKKAKCAKNSESRKKRKWNPKNGSVSNARHHVRAGKDLDASTGQIETFRDQHYSDETGWVGEDLAEKYEEMMVLRDTYLVEEITDYDIMEQVLGRESVRLKGWGRIPVDSSGATDATSRPPERVPSEFEQQLLEKVALLEGALSGVKDTLQTQQSIFHAHGLIPPSSAPDA